MKLYKYNSNNEPINYLDTNIQIEIPEKYIAKEYRAVWVSNVANIDLPTVKDLKEYQNKVIEYFDTFVEYNLNTVFFQVRTNNDAFYESKLNPYSRFFTGEEGKKPPIDVFEWVIEEAKKRNLEIHAWCNPYRISVNGKLSIKDYLQTCDDNNFAKLHPEYIILDKGGKLILNPCKSEVKQFVINSMVEIVTNYNVDGIHLDDYFYPYSGLSDEVNDLEDFNNRANKTMSLGDFRRENVSDLIKGINAAIHKVDKKLKFGVSPFGIWKNKKTDPQGSNTAPACSESYSGQFADSVEWIKNEMLDYIVPQIYWPFGHKIAPFGDILDWWKDIVKGTNVDLLIGHPAYRLGEKGDFENDEEIVNQIKYANSFKTVKGNVFFTAKTFIDKNKKIQGMDKLKKLLNEVY